LVGAEALGHILLGGIKRLGALCAGGGRKYSHKDEYDKERS
jgi:hypothetical protein